MQTVQMYLVFLFFLAASKTNTIDYQNIKLYV